MFYKIIRIINSIFIFFNKKKSLSLLHYFYKSINKNIIIDDIIFDCTYEMSFKRANWFLNKEPNTQKWIKEYFNEDDIFFDIGACVGEYSLLAAKKCKTSVIAFEPSALNFAVLNTNIYLNHLDNKITALNIALNDYNLLSHLESSRYRYIPGKSYNQFHETKEELVTKDSTFKQGVIGYSLDNLIDEFSLPFPNHIKIDVDGNEDKVIIGMKKTLSNNELKTIAIEIDKNVSSKININSILEKNGFQKIYKFSLDKTDDTPENLFFGRNNFQ